VCRFSPSLWVIASSYACRVPHGLIGAQVKYGSSSYEISTKPVPMDDHWRHAPSGLVLFMLRSCGTCS